GCVVSSRFFGAGDQCIDIMRFLELIRDALIIFKSYAKHVAQHHLFFIFTVAEQYSDRNRPNKPDHSSVYIEH
ncbi:MAG: hypothetical protein ABW150_15735, partial [Candidatus Thiodiazotropha sp.]